MTSTVKDKAWVLNTIIRKIWCWFWCHFYRGRLGHLVLMGEVRERGTGRLHTDNKRDQVTATRYRKQSNSIPGEPYHCHLQMEQTIRQSSAQRLRQKVKMTTSQTRYHESDSLSLQLTMQKPGINFLYQLGKILDQ